MILIEIEKPGAEPVTLLQAKGFARIERDDEDALLATLLAAARETVEAMTGLVLARRRMRLCLGAVPADGAVALRRGPVRGVETVTAYDAEGTPAMFGAETVRVPACGTRLTLDASVGAAGRNGVEIELDMGFDAGEVPDALKLAILKIAAASYEVRAHVPAAMQPGLVPRDVAALVAQHRRVSLR